MEKKQNNFYKAFLFIVLFMIFINLLHFIPLLFGYTGGYFKLKKDLFFINPKTKEIALFLKAGSIVQKSSVFDRDDFLIGSMYRLVFRPSCDSNEGGLSTGVFNYTENMEMYEAVESNL